MIPIDLIAAINICLVSYIFFSFLLRKVMPQKTLKLLKHLAGFALAWGAFSTLVGLFEAFNALEAMKEMIPFNVLCGGLKVSLISVLYGFVTYLISLLAYIIFKAIEKTT